MTSLTELLANNQPDQNMLRAGGSIGGALFNDTQPYFDRGVRGAARQSRLLEDARRKRDENAGFAQLTPQALEANGIPPQAANIVSALFHSGIDPRQFSGYQKDRQHIDEQGQAFDAAKAGNGDLQNRLVAALTGKPYTGTKISGGTAYNPGLGPDQTLTATPVGQAHADEYAAQTNAANARANRTRELLPLEASLKRAQADKAKRTQASRAHKPSKAETDYYLGPNYQGEGDKTRAAYQTFLQANNMPDTSDALNTFAQMYSTGPFNPNPDTAFGFQGGATTSVPSAQDGSATAAPSTQGDSPYPEGTKLTGPDGRLYVVKGGVPVPVQ